MDEKREREGTPLSAESREVLIRRTHDWSATAASTATIAALATLEEVDPVELSDVFGATLYDYVDPEALDTLVTDERPISISFSIEKYLIQIDGSELVICHN